MRHRVAARNAFHNTNIGVTADNFILQLPLSGRPSGRLGYDPTIPRSMKDVMTQTLFPRFASTIQTATRFDLTMPGSDHPFFLDAADARGRNVCMMYAPFDHINHSARIAIVGMTPGAHQAQQALLAAKTALLQGKSEAEAAAIAKTHASFSGEPMRTNLIRMMDEVGIARTLGLPSTASLWASDSHFVHFTSALRYPVFVDGQNWSGTPDMVRTPKLREWLLTWTGAELMELKDCLIVPLGPKVAAAMHHLAAAGMVDAERIMDGMPHPSGANQERIAFFLGDKPADKCSSKTNPAAISEAKSKLVERVASFGM